MEILKKKVTLKEVFPFFQAAPVAHKFLSLSESEEVEHDIESKEERDENMEFIRPLIEGGSLSLLVHRTIGRVDPDVTHTNSGIIEIPSNGPRELFFDSQEIPSEDSDNGDDEIGSFL